MPQDDIEAPVRRPRALTLENINLIAQTIGVVAVLVSLVFVGIQVRQNSVQIEANTRSIRASAGFEATHSWAATNEHTTEFSDDVLVRLAASYAPDAKLSDFSQAEQLRFALLHRVLFQKLEGMYFLYAYGSLDRSIWEVRRNWAAGLIRLPLYRDWWAIEKTQHVVTDEFVAAIEAARDATTFVPFTPPSTVPAQGTKRQGGPAKP